MTSKTGVQEWQSICFKLCLEINMDHKKKERKILKILGLIKEDPSLGLNPPSQTSVVNSK